MVIKDRVSTVYVSGFIPTTLIPMVSVFAKKHGSLYPVFELHGHIHRDDYIHFEGSYVTIAITESAYEKYYAWLMDTFKNMYTSESLKYENLESFSERIGA